MPAESAERLLEREREVTSLGDALEEARAGYGRVVLVEAPAGLGKTSLLDAAAAIAADAGFRVVRARASELERDFAYGAVRQLLEPVVARASEPERARLFGGAASLSEPLFAPPGDQPPSASVSADTSFPMLHGLYWLLNNLADEGPVALTVDDLHWSDPESVRFLNHLAPRLDGLPVAVLGSMRSGEAVTADLARLAAAPETTLLRPGPLSVEATATLSERRLGRPVAPEFAAACRTATSGNPYFLEALLREAHQQRLATDAPAAARVRDIAPAAVARAVLVRLARRPAAATALVRAVAVLGDGASLGVAARLAGLDEDEAARAADLLIALALLAPAPALEFAHPIVREAVYTDINAYERAAAHARAAAILASAGAPEERIAAQLVHAPPAGDGERVELLRRVAVDARRRGAPAAAVAWLSRALAEPPSPAARADVLLELGLVEYRLGAPQTVDHLAEAVALSGDPARRGTAVRWLALALTMSGDSDGAVDAIASAIEDVAPHDGELTLLLEADLAAHAQEAGVERRAPAARRLERFAGLEAATPGERLVLASLAFERARASGSERQAAAYLERALAGGWLPGEQEVDVAGPFYLLLVGLLATDALDLAETCVARALADPRVRSSAPAMAYLLEFRGWVSLRQGAVAHAAADARTALELLTARGITFGLAFALGLLVQAMIEEGEVEAAERALRDSGLGDSIPPGMAINDLLEARGLLRLAQGRAREGLDDLLEFGRRDELWGGASPLASRWRSRAALACAAAGDGDGARRLAADDLERARRWGAASGIGVALRACALVGAAHASVDPLREAVDALEHSPARLEHARALVDLGAALRRANRRAEARRELRTGLDLASRCGAWALAERARTELRAAGGRSSDPGGEGAARLTASELRVAELAAGGQSNPEIAQALFVTRKTVETHLGRVYRKLGVAGRGDLARALAGGAATPDPPSAAR